MHRHPALVIRHSSLVTRHSSPVTRHSPFCILHSAFCIAFAGCIATGVASEWGPTRGERFDDAVADGIVGTIRGTNFFDAIDYTPLGAPGKLVLPTQLVHRAEFKAPPVRKPGLVLIDGAKVVTIACNLKERDGTHTLASELAWHLTEMSGREPKVVDISQKPKSGPVIVIGRDDGKAPDLTSIVRRDGDELYIGGVGVGVSQALTYVLESLGCRYLFPGKAGKVIPRRDRVVLDDFALDYVPRLKVRLVKVPVTGNHKVNAGLQAYGFEPKEYSKLEVAKLDRPGNRGFWQWHGVNAGRIVKSETPSYQGTVLAGHNYGDYYAKYFKDHPDWFALQNTGSRFQETNSGPRLCTSNPGFRAQAAADAIRVFELNPSRQGTSICMPDGGYMTYCMCDNCRRLDPANSPRGPGYLYRSKEKPHSWDKHPYSYVSLTDRMLDFSNDMQRRVREKFPGKRVVQFVYSNYTRPPVKVRPDPDIVFFNVAGVYSDAKKIPAVRENLAAWLSFGNQTVWRPNCLAGLGFGNRYPANYGRLFFDDISDFKANGVVGVSLDCCNADYSACGFMFYMIAKAMTNPDRLDYGTIAADWCRAGFGKAADEIAAYMQELERLYMAAADKAMGVGGYMDRFDIAAFEARLDKARKLADGDPDVLARIDYLGVALECAREAAKVRAAWKTGDWRKLGAARTAYKERIREIVIAHPDAVRPGDCCHMVGRPATAEERERFQQALADDDPDRE